MVGWHLGRFYMDVGFHRAHANGLVGLSAMEID